MNKIISFLSEYFDQPDKVLHFLGGGFIAALLTYFFGLFVGVAVIAAVSWGKERYDKAHPDKHTWDGWDAFATLLGGLFGAFLTYYLF